ncbi:MAG TPA: MFS transporter [Xanthobacteraceae bacterium]|nr:MFS transporter [Xanthobacteraceae bacterium]
MTAVSQPTSSSTLGWRTPLVIILCGCGVAMLAFGPRSALGLFMTPLSVSNGWTLGIFSTALAIQNLLWGLAQPIAGGLADKYGATRVLSVGALLYAAGLILTAHSTTPLMVNLSAGVLIGFALAGSSFNLVIGALGKLVPPEWRMLAFGAGTAAGSFGQFLFSPMAIILIDQVGWQGALTTFGCLVLLVLPLSLALATPRADDKAAAGPVGDQQSAKQALAEAFGHRSYVLLVLGFFTCGFQLAFVTAHLQSYLLLKGLPAYVGGWTMAVIGLCNIVGSLSAGWLSGRVPKRYVLSVIYFGRALAVLIFVMLPPSPAAALVYGAITGLLWLSTVPPTNGLVLVMFGTRWLAMLSGVAFVSHQIGGALGVFLGGWVVSTTGSYDPVWWLSVLFGVLSALINLPIVEKPVARLAGSAA